MAKNEPTARIKIDNLLEESKWRLIDGKNGRANVMLEERTKIEKLRGPRNGFIDYLLLDSEDMPLCVLEAKKEILDPLTGKEQAREYAKSQGCRFVILSNGVSHYFWDIEHGSPSVVDAFYTQKQMELRRKNSTPGATIPKRSTISISRRTQFSEIESRLERMDSGRRAEFLEQNDIKILRDYQAGGGACRPPGSREG